VARSPDGSASRVIAAISSCGRIGLAT
jgi:hypothetical protein